MLKNCTDRSLICLSAKFLGAVHLKTFYKSQERLQTLAVITKYQ